MARKESERPPDINEKFGHIPYLNSSLFDVSPLKHQTITISGLYDRSTMPVYSRSVLNGQRGETLNTLDYLFRFLDAKKENPESDTTFLESKIDRLVYELYELSEEEIEIVESIIQN